jgi:hypothetical protein
MCYDGHYNTRAATADDNEDETVRHKTKIPTLAAECTDGYKIHRCNLFYYKWF